MLPTRRSRVHTKRVTSLQRLPLRVQLQLAEIRKARAERAKAKATKAQAEKPKEVIDLTPETDCPKPKMTNSFSKLLGPKPPLNEELLYPPPIPFERKKKRGKNKSKSDSDKDCVEHEVPVTKGDKSKGVYKKKVHFLTQESDPEDWCRYREEMESLCAAVAPVNGTCKALHRLLHQG